MRLFVISYWMKCNVLDRTNTGFIAFAHLLQKNYWNLIEPNPTQSNSHGQMQLVSKYRYGCCCCCCCCCYCWFLFFITSYRPSLLHHPSSFTRRLKHTWITKKSFPLRLSSSYLRCSPIFEFSSIFVTFLPRFRWDSSSWLPVNILAHIRPKCIVSYRIVRYRIVVMSLCMKAHKRSTYCRWMLRVDIQLNGFAETLLSMWRRQIQWYVNVLRLRRRRPPWSAWWECVSWPSQLLDRSSPACVAPLHHINRQISA